jgi:hypothetical protein
LFTTQRNGILKEDKNMLKIGIIGLGDIAQKAYLPVLSGLEDIECHIHTRDKAKLTAIKDKYRFEKAHENIESLYSHIQLTKSLLMEKSMKGSYTMS